MIYYSWEQLMTKIPKWGVAKGIAKYENRFVQALKLGEEVGELFSALLKNDKQSIRDAIGDIFVVLLILCDQINESPLNCLNIAYEEIKDRKGKTSEDGTFIKDKS